MDWDSVLASCRDGGRLGDGFYLEVTLPGDDRPTRLTPAQFRRQLRLQAEDTERRLAVAGRQREEWTEYDGGAVQERHRNASRIRVASGVTVIPERAFSHCDGLREVDLGNVTTISNDAFNGCLLLERVIRTTAPAVEIGERAFGGCISLKEIDLSNVTTIGESAFLNCEALMRVSIPSSVDEDAFGDCQRLAEVGLNEGLQRIEKYAFKRCASLQSISIPSTTLEIIGEKAFAFCDHLSDVTLQEGLQTIGPRAFCDCRSLERITIPSSVTSVGSWAFCGCSSLSEMTLCEGLHFIDGTAFAYRTSLTHINIPPVALVVYIEGRSCQLVRASMPKSGRGALIVSKWMQYRSPSQRTRAKAKVRGILARRHQPEGQKIALIREWFAYYELLDVTTMLELAIWRCNNGNEQDAEARQRNRRYCGNDMNVIIPGVLDYLDE